MAIINKIFKKIIILVFCKWFDSHTEIYVHRNDYKTQSIYYHLEAGYAWPHKRGKPPPVKPAALGYYRCKHCGKTNGETEQQWRDKILNL